MNLPDGVDHDRRTRKPWSLGRRLDDRKWPRFARDFWMLVITGIVLVALLNSSDTNRRVSLNQATTTKALCSLREDVQKRVTSGYAFLATHPHGIAGIPAPTLRASIDNSERTIVALSSLVCPK